MAWLPPSKFISVVPEIRLIVFQPQLTENSNDDDGNDSAVQ